MSQLNSNQRGNLNQNQFAVPSKAPGNGSYPINDKAHARNALARSSGKPVAGRVRAAVHSKYPDIGKQKAATKAAMQQRAQG